MTLEYEVKLTSTRKVMEKIDLNPSISNWEVKKIGAKNLISHYYDTEELKLLFHNLAYRLREEDGKKFVHLKANGRSENGIYIREETQKILRNGEDITSPMYLKKHFPIIFEIIRDKSLIETLTIDNERHILHIKKKESEIEICLDFLHFMRGKRKIEYNEIELELIKGREEDLMECSSLFQTIYGLHPAGASKYELGLRSFNLIPIL